MHVSTFNAKSLPIPWEWKDKIDYFVSKMGYHFVIREVETSDTVKAGNHLNISIEIENVGVAPIYYQIPLNIKIKNKNSQARFPINVDIRKWTPGTHYIKADIQIPQSFDVGEYEVQIGIGGENSPSVCFATDAKQDGYYAVLTSINII